MQRRRFFAARPVQQVPGQRVEVAVQVRRSVAPAAPAAPAAPVMPVAPELSWVNTPDEALAAQILRGDEAGDVVFEVKDSDDGLVHIAHKYGGIWERQPWITTGWTGTPWKSQESDGVPLPMAGPGWRCELINSQVSVSDDLFRMPLSTCYVGIIVGVSAERVGWQLDWDSTADEGSGGDDTSGQTGWGDAVSRSGHVARAVGCQVLVYPVLYGGGNDDADTLTATALVDGVAVGALRFIARRVGW